MLELRHMKDFFEKTVIAGLLGISVFPFLTYAATFKYAAWLPFWKKQSGAIEIALNLEKFQEISPFSYEVRADGTLIDDLKIDQGFWPGWLGAARDMKIKIIPTIAWLYGDQSYKLLSNTTLRRKHEDNIAALIVGKRFDGVDIDYEDKPSAAKQYFSLLLKGLALRLHPKGKILSCTIEARTPADSMYPSDASSTVHQYANDYVAINKYCDEVRIMAYDQGSIDLNLNAKKGNGAFYMPVADPDWVKKVLDLATKTIGRKKIMLGIPTYGYQYEVSWVNGVTTYKRLRAMSFGQAMDLADALGTAPLRNSAGELSLTYATSTAVNVSAGLTYQVNSTSAPPLFTTSSVSAIPVTRYVSFSDTSAIADKIKLAKQYKLRGVVFFKMDGETDPGIWEEMK